MQSKYKENIFSKLTKYHVFDYNNPSQEMREFGAGGLAFFNGEIHVRYDREGYDSRFPLFNIHVNAMEQAHNALLSLLPGEHSEMNNLIHFADNLKDYRRYEYMTKTTTNFRTKMDFLRGKPRQKIMIEWYNLNNLVRDKSKINELIYAGKAPMGKNPYWSTSNSSSEMFIKMKAKGLVPGSICPLAHEH